MVVDAHVHLYTGTPEKKYFPTRQSWHISMRWANISALYNRNPGADIGTPGSRSPYS